MEKKHLTTLFFFIFFTSDFLAAQNVWIQKADFGGGNRSGVSSFGIGNKGYFTCGLDTDLIAYNDLWEYDPSADSWTQKASIPGSTRYSASSFAIGTKGYICLGWEAYSPTPNQLTDLWEYDPAANSWYPKSAFPGAGRYNAVAFSVNNKAYVGLGYKPIHNDFYEYDALTDTWTALANPFPGSARLTATAFSITYNSGGPVTKGYVGAGSLDQNGISLAKDFWEFTPGSSAGSGTWSSIPDLPGNSRYAPFSFSINSKGYVGGGRSASSFYIDFYEFDPVASSWTALPVYPGINMVFARSFTTGNTAWLGTGENWTGNYFNIFWQYAPYNVSVNEINSNRMSFMVTSQQDKMVRIKCSAPLPLSCRFTLFDLAGKKLMSEQMERGQSELILSANHISSGICLFTMIGDGQILKSGKLSLY